ncbi:MAG TPA: bifunctional (p)ppGpp synthetase/guanosine-3',5'-bis(diphosphate) 3'-pyrophosphohydrolase [Rhodanobacteraceae bacterium]|nr:bifunctional (p)ppGpp synthetase/guanosine-3',5'-bis(diphosphate) 3'-pyrophosphohydrolase [Rhodanobacteraceae bacterium]
MATCRDDELLRGIWKRGEAELTATVELLGGLRVGPEPIAACVLHALERAGVALGDDALAGFGADVGELLEGQRAAERIFSLHGARGVGASEGLRRLLLAMVRDLRVVLILLARQLVRMRAAVDADDAEQRELARLTADIHAPLANRLGVWQFKWELEDLAFRFLQPETYRRIARLLDERRGDRETWIARARGQLAHALDAAAIEADIAGRPKHIYSIWRKMQRKGVEFSELYDVRALRVLVADLAACYAALGVVHSLWPHVAGEFDDYIANPKGNQYQSLHTAVIGPGGRTLEVQIRTREMHEQAELGIAAHWRYKEGGRGDAGFERKIAWMRQLLDGKDAGEDEAALLAGFRTDVLEDRVYLLTPRGEVLDLPQTATVLDFAYSIHTDVGHRCRGAKVNGRIVPLNFQPSTGDRVEILTGKVGEPRRDWLSPQRGFLNTHRARDKVRAWFKRVDRAQNLAAGRVLLDRELKRLALQHTELDGLAARFHLQSQDDLFEALALGDITPGQVARTLHEAVAQPRRPPAAATAAKARKPRGDAVTIEGVGNLLTQLARCCQPLPGDAIAGFITRGRGVTVHRADCAQLVRLRARDPGRVMEVEWGTRQDQAYDVNIQVKGYDRKWLHKDVTSAIAAADIHLLGVTMQVDAATGLADMTFALRVGDFGQLSGLLTRLLAVPNVIEARRLA